MHSSRIRKALIAVAVVAAAAGTAAEVASVSMGATKQASNGNIVCGSIGQVNVGFCVRSPVYYA